MKRIIDHDPETGVSHFMYYDEGDGQASYVAQQDVSPLLDHNRAVSNEVGKRFGQNMTHVASLPPIVYWDLKRKGILDDSKAFKRWLNDPENRFFRTHEAHL
jgi:hypothetical protein